MQHLNKLENEENLWNAFKTFDEDGSGFITPDELVKALEVCLPLCLFPQSR